MTELLAVLMEGRNGQRLDLLAAAVADNGERLERLETLAQNAHYMHVAALVVTWLLVAMMIWNECEKRRMRRRIDTLEGRFNHKQN